MSNIYTFTDEEIEKIKYLKSLLNINISKWDKKHFKFSISSRKLFLCCPKYFSENVIDAYILKNELLIYKKAYHTYIKNKPDYKIMPDKVLYLGNIYSFQLKPEMHNEYKIDDKNFIIYSGRNLMIKENLLNFYKKQALFIFPARVQHYAKELKLHISKVKIGVYKSIWGSCGSSTISINEKLILAPLETIDAVIFHELAHLFEPNHSERFYNKLEEIYPAYYKSYIWLKAYMPVYYPPKYEI